MNRIFLVLGTMMVIFCTSCGGCRIYENWREHSNDIQHSKNIKLFIEEISTDSKRIVEWDSLAIAKDVLMWSEKSIIHNKYFGIDIKQTIQDECQVVMINNSPVRNLVISVGRDEKYNFQTEQRFLLDYPHDTVVVKLFATDPEVKEVARMKIFW